MNLAMWMPGTAEMLVIGGIVVLLFGPKLIPRMMRRAGRGLRELRDGAQEFRKGIEEVTDVAKELEKPDDEG